MNPADLIAIGFLAGVLSTCIFFWAMKKHVRKEKALDKKVEGYNHSLDLLARQVEIDKANRRKKKISK